MAEPQVAAPRTPTDIVSPRVPDAPGRAGLTLARRAAGLALIAFSVLPIYALLDPSVTGSAGAYVRGQVANAAGLMWSGTLLALIPLILALRMTPDSALARLLARGAARVAAPSSAAFATLVALIAVVLATLFGLLVLDGKPNLIDGMSQLVHGRILAAGRLAGPTELAEFHVIPNTVLTDAGWVSQYPPGHPLLLALGFLAGAVWLVGPLLLGVTLFFTSLIAERLLPHRRVATRCALLLAATSPFLVAHAGSYMNHTSAAAFTAACVWCAARARDRAAWAIVAGALASFALATRPLAALVMIVAAVAVLWIQHAAHDGGGARRFVQLVTRAIVGALPLTLLHLWYNAHFFGGPFRLGYLEAYGPSHELGFGVDPWGNRYGLREAFAYTSSDLTLLGVALFETPLPLVAIAGLFLLLARRLQAGEAVVAAWALAPVLTNFFYWHHGVFMGPRMLNEAAPAWALLVAVAVAALLECTPATLRALGRTYALRSAVVVALVVVVGFSLAFMVPTRLMSYGGTYLESRRVDAPAAPEGSLVFVHGPWMSRVGSRLMADGMRLDSLETAVRQNATCTLHHYADARERGAPFDTPLDVVPRADSLPPTLEISSGNYIRVAPMAPFDDACRREARADAAVGVTELALLGWQGRIPGTGPGGALFVRDFGPERNARMLAAEPGRTAWVFAAPRDGAAPVLMPYESGMRHVWGDAR